jgi:salicylate hydroxylase
MSTQNHKIVILGGGIAGLATALSLMKFSPPHLRPSIDVFEIRPQPGTIGGAMSLAPNGLRMLGRLGVYDIIKRRDLGIDVSQMELFSIYHPNRLAAMDFAGADNEGVGKPSFKVSFRSCERKLTHSIRAFVSPEPTWLRH